MSTRYDVPLLVWDLEDLVFVSDVWKQYTVVKMRSLWLYSWHLFLVAPAAISLLSADFRLFQIGDLVSRMHVSIHSVDVSESNVSTDSAPRCFSIFRTRFAVVWCWIATRNGINFDLTIGAS
ncbi:hypothetical protein J1614_012201 [Plenodomus biglobosus]|nr:hypothetical protein J1614_012201 [Plenodomus biglobosus]